MISYPSCFIAAIFILHLSHWKFSFRRLFLTDDYRSVLRILSGTQNSAVYDLLHSCVAVTAYYHSRLDVDPTARIVLAEGLQSQSARAKKLRTFLEWLRF
jgi:hypothetical protein